MRAARRQAKGPDLTVAHEVLPAVYGAQPAKQEELDEIVVLEVENSRLKALLVKQLQAQNVRLRLMLERFDFGQKV